MRKNAFTLIEILIAITLTSLLFLGIITFMGSGLHTTDSIEKTLLQKLRAAKFDMMLDVLESESRLSIVASGGLTPPYSTGYVLGSETGEHPYVFVGARSFTGFCENTPDASADFLVLETRTSPRNGERTSVGGYSIDTENNVLSGSDVLIGKEELSGPSSIELSGGLLFVTDALDNRVLYYDTASWNRGTLVSDREGILEPVSLKWSGGRLLVGAKNGLFSVRESAQTGDSFQATITSSGSIAFTDIAVNILWTTYTITGALQTLPTTISIPVVAPTPSTSGEYTAEIAFSNSGSITYQTTVPYATISDGDFTTSTGRVFEQLSAGNRISLVQDASTFESGGIAMNAFFPSDSGPIRSAFPIRNLKMSFDGRVLTVKYKSLSTFDCLGGAHSGKEEVHKIRIESAE